MFLIEICDQDNRIIRLLRNASDIQYAFLKNEIANASFIVATSEIDPDVDVDYGNIVRIYKKPFEPFVGTIVERHWSAGTVTVGLKSAERLLKDRITGLNLIIGADQPKTSGQIAKAICQQSFKNSYSRVSLGITDAPKKHFKEYHYQDVWSGLTDLAEEDECYVWVDSSLKVNFRKTRGINLVDSLLLFEGRQLSDVTIDENADEIITHLVALGEGSSLAQKPKRGYKLYNNNFVRSRTLDVPKVKTAGGLDKPAERELNKNRFPLTTISATVLEENWDQLEIGTRLTLVAYQGPKPKAYFVQIEGINISSSGVGIVFKIIDNQPIVKPQRWNP